MARTTTQIEAEIFQKKNETPELQELNSISETSIWRNFIKVFAFTIAILEGLWDIFRAEVTMLISESKVGTLSWYVLQAKSFQLGDFINKKTGKYEVIDVSKQIITRASARENSTASGIILKIAKSNPAEPLSPQEKTQFIAYMEQKKFAGVGITYVNIGADELSGNLNIYFSATLGEQTAKNLAIAAINEYLDALAFDGNFVTNDVIALIRSKTGILNVKVNSFIASQGGIISIDQTYEAQSGYFKFKEDETIFNMIAV